MGLITVKTRWKEYAPAIKLEEAYMVVSSLSLPLKLGCSLWVLGYLSKAVLSAASFD